MAKLVIHLGDMKTGSTAIQTALSSRAWTCAAPRMIYPCGRKVSHIGLAQSMQGRGNPERTAALFGEIRDEMASSLFDVAVISAEQFENVEPEVLKDALAEHMPEFEGNVRLIAYVRPHADRIASTYAERVKIGMFQGTLTEMQRQTEQRQTFVYAPRFEKWRAVWGDAFTLRPMIRDLLYRKDVVADFLKFALETEDFSLNETPDSNESLSLENLAILREMHLKLMQGEEKPQVYQSTLGRALARRMNDSTFREGTKVRLHRDLAERVSRIFAEDAAALDRAFFDGTPMSDALKAAPGRAVEVEQSVRIEDHFSPREQFLIHTFLDQTQVLIKADPVFLTDQLRNEHRANVLADEDDNEAPPPARAGRGGKAARVGKGKAGPGPGRKGMAGKGKGPGKGKGLRARARGTEAV